MKCPNFDILDENHDVTAYERHYTSSLLSTRQRRNSSPVISTSWPQPWSRGQASVRHRRMTGGTPPPNCLISIHNRRGDVRTALETLSTQIGGEWSASRAKGNYWTLLESEFDSGSTLHLFDTPDFDSMIATISWRQMHKTINFASQLQTNHELTRRIDPSTHVLTASWRDSACGVVGGQWPTCWQSKRLSKIGGLR